MIKKLRFEIDILFVLNIGLLYDIRMSFYNDIQIQTYYLYLFLVWYELQKRIYFYRKLINFKTNLLLKISLKKILLL